MLVCVNCGCQWIFGRFCDLQDSVDIINLGKIIVFSLSCKDVWIYDTFQLRGGVYDGRDDDPALLGQPA